MSLLIHPYAKREILTCFSKQVYIANKSEDEIMKEVETAILLNRGIVAMLNGDITPIEYLEFSESLGIDNDTYQDEIENNLEEIYFGDW